MRSGRTASKVYTDEPSESRTICSYCKSEFDTIVKTEPYYMADGRPDSKFRKCPLCKKVIPIALARYTNIDTQPLGWKGNGPVSFEIAEKSKRRRIRHREENEVFNTDDYKLAGKTDSDLVYFNNKGIILYVNDSGNDGDDME